MNRRSFLAGLGAAVATIAVVTRLGEAKLPAMVKPEWENLYLSDVGPFRWDEPGMMQMHPEPFSMNNFHFEGGRLS